MLVVSYSSTVPSRYHWNRYRWGSPDVRYGGIYVREPYKLGLATAATVTSMAEPPVTTPLVHASPAVIGVMHAWRYNRNSVVQDGGISITVCAERFLRSITYLEPHSHNLLQCLLRLMLLCVAHPAVGKMANPGDDFGGDLKKKYSGAYDRDATKRVTAGSAAARSKL